MKGGVSREMLCRRTKVHKDSGGWLPEPTGTMFEYPQVIYDGGEGEWDEP